MDPQRLKYILKQYHHNRCTPEELEEFERWYASLEDNSRESPFKEGTPEMEVYLNQRYSKFQSRLKGRKRFVLLRQVLKVAAIVVLAAGTGWFIYDRMNISGAIPRAVADIHPGGEHATLTLSNGKTIVLDSMRLGTITTEGALQAVRTDSGTIVYSGVGSDIGAFNTLSTPRGGRYMVRLPDGTKVWLNAATSLKFPVGFSGEERRVTLKGEAYFEVAHDASKPFYVNTDDQEVKVLGTHFIVSSYPDEKEARTTLLEGSVKVSAFGKEAMIKPGQAAVLRHNKLIAESGDVVQAIAWKEGVIEMSGRPLDQILREISRWYDIEVVYSDGIPDIKLNGQIDRGAALSQVLKWLEGMNVRYSLEGRRLTILP